MMTMRIVISLLLPLANGQSCLSDAIPPEQRQNLVNPNGETYPVGAFISNYAASFAANYLGKILIEEKLGYHAKLNLDDLGSGSVAGYYGVTGCVKHSNITDRGCNQGVTKYHVHFESWQGYPLDWNYIQKTYTSMAPRNLGSMGYDGLATTFIPKAARDNAYATQGKALEFYRTWNASWNTPQTFFDSITAIETWKLMPCTASVLADEATLKRHVQFTGDAAGVVATNGVYSVQCHDGVWWLPPSCRATPASCIPWITGGTGWAVEEMMQKFTVFNMPVALGVAASWGNYTTLPLAYNMPFYWWAPDPTFLAKAPFLVEFPAYNAREQAMGLQTSQQSSTPIATLASQDLALLAPMVEKFADNVDMTMAQMDEVLLDAQNTGDSWWNVTCRWLNANRGIWESWIPDESACFAGFGLYDSVLQDFVDNRNATKNNGHKIICQACAPGTYSEKLEDKDSNGNDAVTYICVPCGVGTSQPSGAALGCTPCKTGEYQDQMGSTTCQRCDFGTYQDEEGQVACKSCPLNTNTLGFGSVAASECGCAENQIDMNRGGAFECVSCSEGISCPALSSLVNLEAGTSELGDEFTPKIMPGFFSTAEDPTEVFRCRNANTCPGGTPGSCGGGLIGTPCEECPEGSTWTGENCVDCAGWRQFLWVLAVLAIFGFLTLAYYLTTSKVTAKASVLFATTASFGMLVTSMQNLGLVGTMTVEWPESLRGLFAFCQVLLLDIDSFGFSCIAGQNEPVRYLLSALIFPVGIGYLALCFAVSKLFPQRFRWEGPKVASCMGAFLQVGFSTMSATSLAPMMCYQHPNGQRSILKYPGVICGSDEHSLMLVISWLLLVVFVFGFVALCAFAVCMVPRWSARRQNHFVAAVRFLVFRFRLDSWWFGVPLLVRGPLINLPVVLATDYAPIQVVCIAMVLTTTMVMQMLSWPWKVPMLNLTDAIISFCIVLVVTTSTLYLNKIDSAMYGFAAGVSTAMLSGIGVAIGIMVLMTGSALFYRSAMGGKKELRMFNLGRVPTSDELARKVKEMATELEKTEAGDLSSKIAALSVFDINKVTTCITLLATEVAPPAEEARSFKFNKRIGSSSFDPALKRKPQSRRSDSKGLEEKPAEAAEAAEVEENAITNEPEVKTEVKKDETLKSTWM